MSTQPQKSRTFDYRMSKKVAELTQVVHMLFTRSEEKEVELETIKKAYEQEIENVIQDANQRLKNAERNSKNIEQQMNDEKERLTKLLEAETSGIEQKLAEKIYLLEQQLKTEKYNTEKLSEMLSVEVNELENTRKSRTVEIRKLEQLLLQKEKENEELLRLVKSLKSENSRKLSIPSQTQDLNNENETLKKEVENLEEKLVTSDKTREQLVQKNKNLENELKILKRDLQNMRPHNIKEENGIKINNGLTEDPNFELEKLRREIQRYRMELSNRETNFNRMFTHQNPTLVNRSLKRTSPGPQVNAKQNPDVLVRLAREPTMLRSSLTRERTLPLMDSPVNKSYSEFDSGSRDVDVPDRARFGSPLLPARTHIQHSAAGRVSRTPIEKETVDLTRVRQLTKPKPSLKDNLQVLHRNSQR